MNSKIVIDSNNIHYYYDKINTLIDEYFKWEITAKNLKRYFSDEMKTKNFIQTNNIDNVESIQKIIDDVIDDRLHLESDLQKNKNIQKFESFSFLDDIEKSDIRSCLYKPNYIEITNTHLNILCDFFGVSLDHIKKDKDKITVEEMNNEIECFVYSKEDISNIQSNICDYIIDNLKNEEVVIGNSGISISLKDMIKDEDKKIIRSKLTDEITQKLLNNIHKGFKVKDYDGWLIFQKDLD
jgi:hypothetical protein